MVLVANNPVHRGGQETNHFISVLTDSDRMIQIKQGLIDSR